MNAKRWSRMLIVAVLALITLAACGLAETAQMKPTTPAPSTAPVPSAMPSGGVELTILASGSGVTVLEYQGAGVCCIIAYGGSNVDMVCQNSDTVPVQPTPDGPDKHQVPNGSSEA